MRENLFPTTNSTAIKLRFKVMFLNVSIKFLFLHCHVRIFPKIQDHSPRRVKVRAEETSLIAQNVLKHNLALEFLDKKDLYPDMYTNRLTL